MKNLTTFFTALFFGRNGYEERPDEDVNFLIVALQVILTALLFIVLFTPWGILPHVMRFLLNSGLVNPDGTLNF